MRDDHAAVAEAGDAGAQEIQRRVLVSSVWVVCHSNALPVVLVDQDAPTAESCLLYEHLCQRDPLFAQLPPGGMLVSHERSIPGEVTSLYVLT